MTSGRQYARVRIDIWRDEDWTKLPPDSMLLYMFLISHPKTSSVGVAPLQITKWSKSLNMPVERVEDALRTLVTHTYLVVDDDTEEVLIRSFFRHDVAALGAPNVILSALKCALTVESMTLRKVLSNEISRIEREWGENHKILIKALLESHSVWHGVSHSVWHGVCNCWSCSTKEPTYQGNLPTPEKQEKPPVPLQGFRYESHAREGSLFAVVTSKAVSQPKLDAVSTPPQLDIPDWVRFAVRDAMGESWSRSRRLRKDLEDEVRRLVDEGDDDEQVWRHALNDWWSKKATRSQGREHYIGDLKHDYDEVIARISVTGDQVLNSVPRKLSSAETKTAEWRLLRSNRKEIDS